ncbi:MAG: PDZ domain-containing protein [Methanosarcinales archaeon]|nr:PDZ domain-containing protein [Methanosarcinales archaeon]
MGNIDVNHELQGLCHLEPRALMGREERRLLQEEHLARHGELMAKKAALEKEGQALLEQDLARYQEIDQQLVVRPTDGWSQVVGKAIALRQLGRTAESLAAFSRYGEMFAAADPGAGQYARTAQRLTMSMDALGVDGGVYIYELAPGGAAKSAGMQVGDVIVDYGGQAVRDMGTMVQALRSAPARDRVRAGYLRLREDGTFELRTASLPGEALGAGYMPI